MCRNCLKSRKSQFVKFTIDDKIKIINNNNILKMLQVIFAVSSVYTVIYLLSFISILHTNLAAFSIIIKED